jgi:hypothetical protein
VIWEWKKIAFELCSKNKLTGCISVKIRYSDFQIEQKQSSIIYTAVFYKLRHIQQGALSEIYAAYQIRLKSTEAWILYICIIKLT